MIEYRKAVENDRASIEELGAEVEVICKIGVVSDYYNLIHRHNINNYYLCRVKSFGDKHLTQDEISVLRTYLM
ncbi:NUDIX hydrolase [Butyrivibrio sp. WCD2001]|uniref:NUDIX hydrolase n=1 Tax=Butyrivibrio sp. WCD2001 TaxID=1280681 RepID=UPI0004023761|nr:NUDIX hydrolase [Butyrivibrio sp. WCD2001]